MISTKPMNLEECTMTSNNDVVNTGHIAFLLNLSKILQQNKISKSDVDEDLMHKSQQYEQEIFYLEMYYGIESEYDSDDNDINKTIYSGSSWMR